MRQGWWGAKDLRIAEMTDEDSLEYATPVKIPGLTEFNNSVSTNDWKVYADDDTWLNGNKDSGGSGTMSFRDVEMNVEIRKLIARLAGYIVDSHGRVIGTSDKPQIPFAVMFERTGYAGSKRKCYYKVKLGKPSEDAKTLEETPDITTMDFPYTYVPVTLPSGLRVSFYNDYPETDTYEKFYDKVDTTIAEADATASTAKE